ncbi:hypothetical protein OnM2_065035 [Erysiphe neolycopersici]|uniref:Uncharacterized protein n=1 Tax=Erysiphe neolycopersici TaxID=212602 RepID=A0A420HMX9_9PEZI|nr:hypothetical protein OnM2_065035 [Erysiphe neolycopersici]
MEILRQLIDIHSNAVYQIYRCWGWGWGWRWGFVTLCHRIPFRSANTLVDVTSGGWIPVAAPCTLSISDMKNSQSEDDVFPSLEENFPHFPRHSLDRAREGLHDFDLVRVPNSSHQSESESKYILSSTLVSAESARNGKNLVRDSHILTQKTEQIELAHSTKSDSTKSPV